MVCGIILTGSGKLIDKIMWIVKYKKTYPKGRCATLGNAIGSILSSRHIIHPLGNDNAKVINKNKINNRQNMKAITVKQPWASLIVEGIKDVENRTWACPEKYIGKRVLIHAGGTRENFNIRNDIFTKDQLLGIPPQLILQIENRSDTLGAIIGSVQIVDCVINHHSVWAEITTQMSPENTYNWVLANPIKFTNPIPCKGKLRFWEYENIKNINFK